MPEQKKVIDPEVANRAVGEYIDFVESVVQLGNLRPHGDERIIYARNAAAMAIGHAHPVGLPPEETVVIDGLADFLLAFPETEEK